MTVFIELHFLISLKLDSLILEDLYLVQIAMSGMETVEGSNSTKGEENSLCTYWWQKKKIVDNLSWNY